MSDLSALLPRNGVLGDYSRQIGVGRLQQLLQTASRAFPVITIHREKIAPDVCHIGSLTELTENRVSLLEIGPDACRDDTLLSYRISEITRIDFGGGYEEALILVGGMPARRRPEIRSLK
jgi:hypothetical protein